MTAGALIAVFGGALAVIGTAIAFAWWAVAWGRRETDEHAETSIDLGAAKARVKRLEEALKAESDAHIDERTRLRGDIADQKERIRDLLAELDQCSDPRVHARIARDGLEQLLQDAEAESAGAADRDQAGTSVPAGG